MAARISQHRNALDGQAKLLASLGYHSVLARGFALVRNADGATVRSAHALSPGQALDIEFADGRVQVEAKAVTKSGDGAAATAKTAEKGPPASQKRPSKDQGSLF